MVRAKIENSVFCFVNIYAHNQGIERVLLFTLLEKVLVLINYLQDHLVVGGDFKCITDFTLDANATLITKP